MENIIEQYINMMEFIRNEVLQNYRRSVEDVDTYTKEQEDLVHEIELNEKMDRTSGYRAYRQLREIRQYRRMAKNQSELLGDLSDFFEENKPFFDRLSRIKGDARKTFEIQNNRVYGFRAKELSPIQNPTVPSFETMLFDFKKANKVYSEGGKLRKK